MRKTQKEQIKAAKTAYIMPINSPRDGMGTHRFSVHLCVKNQLEVLWPEDNHEGKKSKEMLPSQVYSTRKTYPAYHFALGGCGYSKTYQIKSELQQINKNLIVFTIDGWSPSPR
jgi:hypothetical protein